MEVRNHQLLGPIEIVRFESKLQVGPGSAVQHFAWLQHLAKVRVFSRLDFLSHRITSVRRVAREMVPEVRDVIRGSFWALRDPEMDSKDAAWL